MYVLEGNPFFSKGKDIIIIILLLALAGMFWLVYSYMNRADSPYAAVYYKDELVTTVKLDKNQSFSVDPAPQVGFEVSDGAICFSHSDCPDQVCVLAGRLSHPGDFAACLPNGLSVWIEGGETVDDENTVDIIVK